MESYNELALQLVLSVNRLTAAQIYKLKKELRSVRAMQIFSESMLFNIDIEYAW